MRPFAIRALVTDPQWGHWRGHAYFISRSRITQTNDKFMCFMIVNATTADLQPVLAFQPVPGQDVWKTARTCTCRRWPQRMPDRRRAPRTAGCRVPPRPPLCRGRPGLYRSGPSSSPGQTTNTPFLTTARTFRNTVLTAGILWKTTLGCSRALPSQARQRLGKLEIKLCLYPACHHCITWTNAIKTAIIIIDFWSDSWFGHEVAVSPSVALGNH